MSLLLAMLLAFNWPMTESINLPTWLTRDYKGMSPKILDDHSEMAAVVKTTAQQGKHQGLAIVGCSGTLISDKC